MSALAIAIIVFGLLILVTRGPLVYAPDQTRNRLVSLFDSERKMRKLGIAIAALGVFFIWAADGAIGGWAVAVYLFGVLALLISLLSMIPFPGRMQPLATRIWKGFSETTLRLIGITSTVFGAWLIYVGFTL
ncbi:MAG: hypothetical protein V3R20_00275 [Sphingomonadales bacterium]